MDAEKRRLRDEVAKLSDAVRDLRDDIAEERRARVTHYCQPNGCQCGHTFYWPAAGCNPNIWQQPVTIKWGTTFEAANPAPGCAGNPGATTTYMMSATACASPSAQLS
jgi:hypothetical protein